MDTLVDEAEQGQVGERARARPSSHLRARSPAHLPPVARPEAMRPSLASIDPDVQVQWFERTPPLLAPSTARPPFDDDVDVDVSLELCLDASLDVAPPDADDSEIDVPTCVWRRTRSIWTSED